MFDYIRLRAFSVLLLYCFIGLLFYCFIVSQKKSNNKAISGAETIKQSAKRNNKAIKTQD